MIISKVFFHFKNIFRSVLMELIIIIPTHKRPELLGRTLDSLAKCDFPDEYSKTIVVENGGKFGVEELVKDYKNIQVEYQYQELGNKSAALNSVLDKVPPKSLIYFTDDDVRFSTRVLIAYCKAAKNNPYKYVYGGPFEVDYEYKKPESWLSKYLPDSAKGWNKGNNLILSKNINFIGFNWAAFAHDILANGGFNNQFGPGNNTIGRGQETTMQEIMYKNGWQSCYIPDAKVWHYVPEIRSDENFAITHLYKEGKTIGAKLRKYKNPLIISTSIIMKIIYHLFKVLIFLIFNFFTSDIKEKKFHVKYKWNYLKGVIEGYKYRDINKQTFL